MGGWAAPREWRRQPTAVARLRVLWDRGRLAPAGLRLSRSASFADGLDAVSLSLLVSQLTPGRRL